MKHLFLSAFLALASVTVLSADEKTDVVESGTYQATIKKVENDPKEIYVKTPDDKVLELYLKKHTVITKGTAPAEFEALKEGQKVEVKVEKKGNKLNPLEVKILE